MKHMNILLKSILPAAALILLTIGCSDTKPNDPSEGSENIQNEQGENYGTKGDDRPEPSQPGADTSNAGASTSPATTH
jgi:hypothetical protein